MLEETMFLNIIFLLVNFNLVCCGINMRSREVIVVAGNFSLDGQLMNIAEYDVQTGEWSTQYLAQLYLYGESNGVVWDFAVNRSNPDFSKLFVVGTFDTVSESSQIRYCSVGEWDGINFGKVGEGLCPRGIDSTITIQTMVLGSGGDIFVGGSFESRVWDGKHFVQVFHVAHFDGQKAAWLPLLGGSLKNTIGVVEDYPKVATLACDGNRSVLFIGGKFNAIDSAHISPGLAMWSLQTGMVAFPGGGLRKSGTGTDGTAIAIAYEPMSESLFVAGEFDTVGGSLTCSVIAVWHRVSNKWTCLHQPTRSISTITSIFLDTDKLYIAGWASSSSDWMAPGTGRLPYAIARLSIVDYIAERQLPPRVSDDTGADDEVPDGSSSGGNLVPSDPIAHGTDEDDADHFSLAEGNLKTVSGSPHSQGLSHLTSRHNLSVNIHSTSLAVAYSRLLSAGSRPSSQGQQQQQRQQQQLGQYQHHYYLRKNGHRRNLLRRRLRGDDAAAGRIRSFTSEVLGRNASAAAHEYRDIADGSSSSSKSKSTKKINDGARHVSKSNRSAASENTARSFPSSSSSSSSYSYSQYFNQTPPTLSPVRTPMPIPWTPKWEWLPGWTGANGPIMKLSRGVNGFEGALFIVGAFNNDPSVIVWRENAKNGSYKFSLTSHHSLYGLITAVAQLRLPYEEISPPSPVPEPSQDTSFIFYYVFCVVLGLMVGLICAGVCVLRGNLSILSDGDEPSALEVSIPKESMNLNELSGVNGIDFRECFDRAMRARHLPTHESLLIINSKDIDLAKIIGEGSFGRVWKGQWRNNAVAVKEFVFAQAAIKGGSIDTQNIVEEIVGEAGLMQCLRHPKILLLYGCSLTMNAIWIVSELCRRGSLRMVLNDAKMELSVLTKVSLCIDVADGMQYLHERKPPIIHRDLKSHNIFITENSRGGLVAKIGDWGSARAVALSGAKSMTHGVGTACWIAPEVINFAHFSKDSDVYAFGIVLWEAYTRKEVYEGLSAAQIIAKVAHDSLRPKVPLDCPWSGIMVDCWKKSPSDRPGFGKIMQVLSKIYTEKKSELSKARAKTAAAAAVGAATAGVGTRAAVAGGAVGISEISATSERKNGVQDHNTAAAVSSNAGANQSAAAIFFQGTSSSTSLPSKSSFDDLLGDVVVADIDLRSSEDDKAKKLKGPGQALEWKRKMMSLKRDQANLTAAVALKMGVAGLVYGDRGAAGESGRAGAASSSSTKSDGSVDRPDRISEAGGAAAWVGARAGAEAGVGRIGSSTGAGIFTMLQAGAAGARSFFDGGSMGVEYRRGDAGTDGAVKRGGGVGIEREGKVGSDGGSSTDAIGSRDQYLIGRSKQLSRTESDPMHYIMDRARASLAMLPQRTQSHSQGSLLTRCDPAIDVGELERLARASTLNGSYLSSASTNSSRDDLYYEDDISFDEETPFIRPLNTEDAEARRHLNSSSSDSLLSISLEQLVLQEEQTGRIASPLRIASSPSSASGSPLTDSPICRMAKSLPSALPFVEADFPSGGLVDAHLQSHQSEIRVVGAGGELLDVEVVGVGTGLRYGKGFSDAFKSSSVDESGIGDMGNTFMSSGSGSGSSSSSGMDSLTSDYVRVAKPAPSSFRATTPHLSSPRLIPSDEDEQPLSAASTPVLQQLQPPLQLQLQLQSEPHQLHLQRGGGVEEELLPLEQPHRQLVRTQSRVLLQAQASSNDADPNAGGYDTT